MSIRMGTYEILEKFGSQSQRKFGSSYKAIDLDRNVLVALKVVEQSKENTIALQRLEHEATFNFTTNGLPQNVVLSKANNAMLLARDYIQGKTLEDYWRQLSRRERLPFLKHLFNALNAIYTVLNRERIVHCDIKPSNIIVDEHQSIHLIDFGLAVSDHSNKARKTLFPLGYAAPELILNQLEIVNQSTDVFAAGILIWRLYSGRMPLTHPNPSIYTNLQITHPLPTSNAMSKQLNAIVAKMCVKHVFVKPPNQLPESQMRDLLQSAMEQRYQSFEEISAALNTVDEYRWLPKKIFSKS